MGEALVAAALLEFGDRLIAPESRMWAWLDEVTRPPADAEVDARRTYSGIFVVLQNRIVRALALEHRGETKEPQVDRDGWGNPVRRPHSQSWEDTYDTEEDGRLPGFG